MWEGSHTRWEKTWIPTPGEKSSIHASAVMHWGCFAFLTSKREKYDRQSDRQAGRAYSQTQYIRPSIQQTVASWKDESTLNPQPRHLFMAIWPVQATQNAKHIAPLCSNKKIKKNMIWI
jgi:hypothetical protein